MMICEKSNQLIFNCRCSQQGGNGWYLNSQGTAEKCECFEERVMNSKKAFAEMPEQLKEFRISDYQINIYDNANDKELARNAKKACYGYVKNFDKFNDLAKGLYLYSYTKGSGKTRLAVAIGNALINQYKCRVKFTTTTRLIEEIKCTFQAKQSAEYTLSEYMTAIKSVDVLILDDIGTEKLTDWVNETFYEIINQRMLSKKITVYTSNCTVEELKHDDRIKSRIDGMVYKVKCPEQDIRKKLNDIQNVDIEKLLFGME